MVVILQILKQIHKVLLQARTVSRGAVVGAVAGTSQPNSTGQRSAVTPRLATAAATSSSGS